MVKSSNYRGVTLFRPTGKWRAQISAGGKTTSLGDHDSEEEAAKAFDRAAINKSGRHAKTNFPISQYDDEMDQLTSMSQTELVAMLRSKARKSGTQTSHYRGVSLLKQTGKWHAQINVGGKQVHLGFFPTEDLAACAYDRAAINKGARDGGKIITNFDITNYMTELEYLRRIPQEQLVAALSSEATRKVAMELLADGFTDRCTELFRIAEDETRAQSLPTVQDLVSKAERAAPKPTAKDPLYGEFGTGKKKKSDGPKTPEKLEQRNGGGKGGRYTANGHAHAGMTTQQLLSSLQGMDSPRGPKRAAKRRLVDGPGDYAEDYGNGTYDHDTLMAMAAAVNGAYPPHFPYMSTNGGPLTPLRPNEDEAMRAAKERRRARARKVYTSEEEEEQEEEDYLSMLKSPSTPNRKALPNGKRPSPLRRKLYYDEAPSVEQDDSTGKDVPDTVGSASRRRKAAPARAAVN